MRWTLKQWEHCRKLWHDTCEEVLGKKKTQHKEWISANTIHKLETRRERKTVLNNSRTRAAEAKAQEEYTAVEWKQQTDKPVVDKNRNPQTATKEQLKRWPEHFSKLLDHPNPVSPPDTLSRRDRTAHQLWKTLKGRDQEGHHDWGVGRLQDRMRYQQKPSKQT